MKALILAAGFGTRLLPYTATTPKCLFPIGGRPLLDWIIENLQAAGCREIIVNTHHLAPKIEDYIDRRNYKIPVQTRYEPQILGTGGAIKNVSDFWDDGPFMVINSDIVTDISFKAVYDFHFSHPCPATLVLNDDPEFNTVCLDPDGWVIGFESCGITSSFKKTTQQTFTGIQVLDPEVLALIPANSFSSSIDMYNKLLANGKKLKAFFTPGYSWTDVGTPARYRSVVLAQTAPEAFQQAFGNFNHFEIKYTALQGDGSDRKWYRLSAGKHTLVLSDHGIRNQEAVTEVDSFVTIGRHLTARGVPVPQIYFEDTFSGLVFLEDLGDTHLQTHVRNLADDNAIYECYQSIIDIMIKLSTAGVEGFKPSWTYQTPDYNRTLILEKECRYFVEAFLNGYQNKEVRYEELQDEFNRLADQALANAVSGLMHRDFQSRNIMVKNNRYFLIDFQGARIGPIQYDLASLLIDPYTALPDRIQVELLSYCFSRISAVQKISQESFYKGYRYCALTRNLQILGAFGYLSKQKDKTFFEAFIPQAIKTLKKNLFQKPKEFPRLFKIIK